MRAKRMERHGRRPRWLDLWQTPAVVLTLLVLLAIVSWALPRPIERAAMLEAGRASNVSVAPDGRQVLRNNASPHAPSSVWWQAVLLMAVSVGYLAVIGYKKYQRQYNLPTFSWTYPPHWIIGKGKTAPAVVVSLCVHSAILLPLMFIPLAKAVVDFAQKNFPKHDLTVVPPEPLPEFQVQPPLKPRVPRPAEPLPVDQQQAQALPEIQRNVVEPITSTEQPQASALNLPVPVARVLPTDRMELVRIPATVVQEQAVPEILEVARTQPLPLDLVPIESDAVLPIPNESLPAEQRINSGSLRVDRQPVAEMTSPKRDENPRGIDLPRLTRAVPLPVAGTEQAAALPSSNAVPLDARKATLPGPVQEFLTVEQIAASEPAREMASIASVQTPVDRTMSASPTRPREIDSETRQFTVPVTRTVVRPNLDLAQSTQSPTIAPGTAPPRAAQPVAVETVGLLEALPPTVVASATETTVTKADLSLARGQLSHPPVTLASVVQADQIPRREFSIARASIDVRNTITEVSAFQANGLVPKREPPIPSRSAPRLTAVEMETVQPVQTPVGVAKSSEEIVMPSDRAEIQIARVTQPNPTVVREAAPALAMASAMASRFDLNKQAELLESLRQSTTNAGPVPPIGTVPISRQIARTVAPPTSEVIQSEVSPLPSPILVPVAPRPAGIPLAGTPTEGTGSPVTLGRMVAVLPTLSSQSRAELAGTPRMQDHRPIRGSLIPMRTDASPTFNSMAATLGRPTLLAKPVAMATDNAALEVMFTLRRGESRKEFIELFGGNQASEAAVNQGLEWLATHQNPEGSWSLHRHEGNSRSDTAATGLALLPFLAAGHTSHEGKHQPVVAKAVDWLIATQKPNGDLLGAKDDPHHHMYSHGVAAIALCEAYGMTRRAELREPAQRSLDFIVAAQHAPSGGWRYRPNESGDTSVVGWQVMALKSGEMAGLTVPVEALEAVKRWLAAVESNQPAGGQFGYTNRGATPTMTAEGLLCVQFLGTTRNSARMRAGADYLLKNPPVPGRDSSYYWYYGTQVMYHMQGEYWAAWNEKMRDLLVSTQVKEGGNAGSWNPTDQWEKSGGRVYATSIKLLILEVYYRHLPLYQQLDQ